MDSILMVINIIVMLLLTFIMFRTDDFERLLDKFHFNKWNIRKNLRDENARKTVKWLIIWGWSMIFIEHMNNVDISFWIRVAIGLYMLGLYIKLFLILTAKKEDFYVSSFTIACTVFFILIGFMRLWDGAFEIFSLLNIAVLSISSVFLFRGIKFYKKQYSKIFGIITIWFLVCKITLEVSYIYSNDNIKAISGMKNLLDGLIQTIVVAGVISYVAAFIDKNK